MHIFYNPEDNHTLPTEESWHSVKVMRLKAGSKAYVVDGKGAKHLIEITVPHLKKCEYKILETHTQADCAPYTHIALSPTKSMDRIEWFVEKSIEIGVNEISFLLCKNSERKIIKLERLHKISVSAMKQSGRTHLTKINPLIPFKAFVEHNKEELSLIAHLHEKGTALDDVIVQKRNCMLIGPEGDFSKEEVALALANNYKAVSLGNTVLRTETAGIVASYALGRS